MKILSLAGFEGEVRMLLLTLIVISDMILCFLNFVSFSLDKCHICIIIQYIKFLYPLSSLLIECLILSIVEREDSYGYEISQTVKLVANIKESTLYPILRKLEQNGYLHTYSQEFQGRNRKYYSITDSGKEQLIFLKKEWNEYYHTIDDIIEGRMIPDGK